MNDDAPGGEKQAPEVETSVLLEGEEDLDVYLDGVVNRDGKEARDDHRYGDRHLNPPSVAFAAHLVRSSVSQILLVVEWVYATCEIDMDEPLLEYKGEGSPHIAVSGDAVLSSSLLWLHQSHQ